MFSDAIIKTENNLVNIAGLKNGISDQKKAITEIKDTLMNEINLLHAENDEKNKIIEEQKEKINAMNDKIEQLYKVLINHATIINNIKDAITSTE